MCVCLYLRAALDRAAVLLSMKRGIMRLDNVWGVGGGQRPVKHLIKEVRDRAHGTVPMGCGGWEYQGSHLTEWNKIDY